MRLPFRKTKRTQQKQAGGARPQGQGATGRRGEPGWVKETGPADYLLLAVALALVAFGVVMVFSASAVYANQQHDDGHHFLVRQGFFALFGVCAMLIGARLDYHHYRKFTYPMLGVAVLLMMVVALGFGHSVGGASRWIRLGPINIQPSEVAKLALVMWLAYSLSKKSEHIRSFSIGFLPHVLMAGFLMLLCLEQPDFGSAVMIGLLT
ncbi:MAG: FtsW/RodA/SpoVE family cell cycle protein, partial [Myxococcota bacterium]